VDLGDGSVSVVHDIENSVDSSFEHVNNSDAPGYFMSDVQCSAMI